MQIDTTLTSSELESLAGELGMALKPGRSSGYLLRPTEGMSEEFRVRGHSGRRVHAVTWSGHYAFMAAVFLRDPDARISSALAVWKSAAHFFESAPMQQPHHHTSPMNWKDAR